MIPTYHGWMYAIAVDQGGHITRPMDHGRSKIIMTEYMLMRLVVIMITIGVFALVCGVGKALHKLMHVTYRPKHHPVHKAA